MHRVGRDEEQPHARDGQAVSRQRIFLTALVVFLGVAFLTGVPSLLAMRALRNARVAILEADGRGNVELAKRLLDKELFEIAGDLAVTKGAPAVVQFASTPNRATHRDAAGFLARVASAYDRYPTIQIFDAHGRERVRVEHDGTGTTLAPEAELTDLSGEPFVQAGLELRADEVQLSGLEGTGMRLASPILDAAGSVTGLLVFSYDATGLLDDLLQAFDHGQVGRPLLVQGDAMLRPFADGVGWATSPTGDENLSFLATYPEIAARIAERDEGSARTSRGLFIWATSRPLSDPAARLSRVESDLAWILLTHTSADSLRRTLSIWSTPWVVVVSTVSALLMLSLSVAIAIATENLRAARRHAELDAMTDALTGAANRRAFQDAVVSEIARSERYGSTFALAMLDIDLFKLVNDTYGHDAGDQVLSRLVAISRTVLRGSDTIFRIGGEEFAVLLPNTPLGDAESVLERFRGVLAEQCFPFTGDRPLELSVSIGLTSSGRGRHGAHVLLTTADNALYRAKAEGRDRLVTLPLDP